MKTGVSSLNPYAESYIPLAKRKVNDNLTDKDIKYGTEHFAHHNNERGWIAHSSQHDNEFGWMAHRHQHTNPSIRGNCVVTRGTGKHGIPETSALKTHPAHGSLVQNPAELIDKKTTDEEFDMDMELLHMSFPGLSNESLMDVYLANSGDLEAAIDMLNQLEMHAVESSETLPDTLDIGDVSETVSSSTFGVLNLKNVAGEASSASSSGSAVAS